MIFIFILLFVIAFILALRSMKDLNVPDEIKKMLRIRKLKGTIVFLKDKITHYSSPSSSSSR